MSVSTDREDVDTWAPVGWVPSDPGFDEAPFGSVLGDPLMGSPLFDVAVLDDPFEHRLEDRKTVRGGRAASAEGAQSDPAAVLRAQVEERVRAMRRGVPQSQQAAPRSSGYGRAPGAGLGAACAHVRAGARAGAAVVLRPTAGATRRVRRRIRRPWSTDGLRRRARRPDGLRRRTGSAWAAGRVRPAGPVGRFRAAGTHGR